MSRSASPTSALYVRLPAAEADKLDRAAQALGVPKKDLVTGLVSTFVDPDSEKGMASLGDLATRRLSVDLGDFPPQVGFYSFHQYDLPEVLTPQQASQLLQLTEQVVLQLAERGELPGRKLGDAWRFSRAG